MQFGFRSTYSTTDATFFAIESIREALDQNQFEVAVLFDSTKTFDSISHDIIFKKLVELSFDSNALSMKKSYLRGSKKIFS